MTPNQIYFYHIRKCGGQSIYHAIFQALTGASSEDVEHWLTWSNIIICEGKIIIGWHAPHINRHKFNFAFGHFAMHELLPMPEDIFTFTYFREPSERVISHYRMLKGFRETGTRGDVLKAEKGWSQFETFGEFVELLPDVHMLRQLYMFSAEYNVDEALENINNLSYWFTMDNFAEKIKEFGKVLGLNLKTRHVMPSHSEFDGMSDELGMLREKLEPEYELWEALKKQNGTT